jgi:hypothetical protein
MMPPSTPHRWGRRAKRPDRFSPGALEQPKKQKTCEMCAPINVHMTSTQSVVHNYSHEIEHADYVTTTLHSS